MFQFLLSNLMLEMNMDQCILSIHSIASESVSIYDSEGICENCPALYKAKLYEGETIKLYLRTDSSHLLELKSKEQMKSLDCKKEFWPKEYGYYTMNVTPYSDGFQCSEIILKEFLPAKSTFPVVPPELIVIFTIFILLYFLPNLIRFICRFGVRLKVYRNCFFFRFFVRNVLASTKSDNELQHVISLENEDNPSKNLEIGVQSKLGRTGTTEVKLRLMSLDTFRGLTVVLMMFVNAGGGGYWYFSHAIWNGLTFADIPHPWFNWIMGLSLVVAKANENPYITRQESWKRVFQRVAKLYLVGFTMNSMAFGSNLQTIPSLGVPQDLAILYLGGAFLQNVLPRPNRSILSELQQSCNRRFINRWLILRELRAFWRLTVAAVIGWSIHLFIAFGINVPGCGRGYLGPGGKQFDSHYSNCTGGAFSYLDQKIIGKSHMQYGLLFQSIYKTNGQQDSYGVATLPSQFTQVILGMLAGEIFLLYKHLPTVVICKWISKTLMLVLITLVFCNPITCILPLNRRIWSLSCICYTSSIATLLMVAFYYLVDVRKMWTGSPLYYPGVNSMALFVGQFTTRKIFPFAWATDATHAHLTFMHLWQTFFWIIISIIMYRKKIFIKM